MSSALLRSAASAPSFSGRQLLSTEALSPKSLFRSYQRSVVRRKCMDVRSLYNFADAAESRVPGQRRNRGLEKKQARELMDVVRGLTFMTAKQLAAVAHLLPPGAVEAVGIAARLPRSNQGRKRQEALVAKMLRGQLTEQQMDKLEEAVALAEANSGVFVDGDVSGLVAAWQEGLLRDDQAVLEEVYGYPAAWTPDHQQLRALVRQCQQTLEEEEAAKQKQLLVPQAFVGVHGNDGDIGNNCSSGNGGDEGEDDLATELARAAGRRQRKGGPESRSKGPLQSLRKMLRPLALRVVQEGLGAA